MQCIVVDDDEIVCNEIGLYISRAPYLKLDAVLDSAHKAHAHISSRPVDLVFLDVVMPGMTGLELLEVLGNQRPQVILMTLERDFAADAFNYDVTDFLVKPVAETRFLRATGKAHKRFLSNLQGSASNNQDYVFVRTDGHLARIDLGEITYIQSLGNYVSIHTEHGKRVIHMSMKEILEKLPADCFARVHQTYIVRIDKISDIEGTTIVIGKSLIPIGRSYKNKFLKRINLI